MAEVDEATLTADDVQKAVDLFSQRQFQECAKLLKVCAARKPNCLPLEHNLAVADFLASGQRDPHKLLEAFDAVLTKTQAPAETTASSTGKGKKQQTQQASSASQAQNQDYDTVLVKYNKAVVLYQLKLFCDARVILEQLNRNIASLDELLAVRVCFLLLDLYIQIEKTDLAESVVEYMCGAGRFSFSFDDDSSSPTTNANSDSQGDSNAVFSAMQFKFMMHLYKTRLLLAQRNIKNVKKEIKSALQVYQREMKSFDELKQTSGSNNTTAAAPFSTLENCCALYLKANLQYQQGNFSKATKLLQAQHIDSSMRGVYLNNLGCIHYQMGHKSTAGFYFSQALDANYKVYERDDSQSSTTGSSKKQHGNSKKQQPQQSDAIKTSLPAFFQDKKAEILYNCGLELLDQRQPETAFRCFQESALQLYHLPTLWLRMADCAVQVYLRKTALLQDKQLSNCLTRDLGSVQKDGQQILLPVSGGPDHALKPKAPSERTTQHAHGLRNLDSKNSKDFAAEFESATVLPMNQAQQAVCPPNEQLSLHAALRWLKSGLALLQPDDKSPRTVALRKHFLAVLSWSSLCLRDATRALRYAQDLLALDSLLSMSEQHRAHTYAAEACLALNRRKDAQQHLDPQNFSEPPNSSSNSAAGDHAKEKCRLYTNLAAVYILRNDLSKALQCASQALAIEAQNPHALRTLLYLQIRHGKTRNALQMLQRRRAVPVTKE